MQPIDISDEDQMTIGAFARRSRLSLKALRIYDEMGLLRPAWVDPSNGYRYYVESQVQRARLIGHLRQLEMPLGTIANVLDLTPSSAAEEIHRYWRDVERELTEKRWLVDFVTGRLTEGGRHMYTIETRDVPEQTVISQQRHVLADSLPAFIDEAMTHLYGLAGPSADPAGSPFVIYRGQVNMDSDGPVEVCIPVTSDVSPDSETTVRTEPAHREAYTRITKSQVEFPRILEAYDAVESWADEADRTIADSPREVYFVDWASVGDDDPACDIAFPIAE